MPAVCRVTFELFFWQAGWFCVGAAIYHAVIAGIGAFALSTATDFGGIFVGTGGTAGSAVTGIVAVDIDADALFFSGAERFRFILT